MSLDALITPEETAAAYQQVAEVVLAYLRDMETQTVLHDQSSDAVRTVFEEPLPEAGTSLSTLVDTLAPALFSASLHPGSPHFFGYAISSGTVAGQVGGMLAQGVPLCGGKWGVNAAQAELSKVLVGWVADFIGYPTSCGGLFTSGGTMANLLALATARHHHAPFDVHREGLTAGMPLRIYASSEAHISFDKCAILLGLGQRHLCKLPVGGDYRLDIAALEAQIREDRAAGYHPICVVGNAGTTNTGAVDPLDNIADICEREKIWFHVDAAYGGPAAATAIAESLFSGMERADSVTIDPHKWMYVPVEAGCLLVREVDRLRSCFTANPAYLSLDEEADALFDLYKYGLQLTRNLREVKVWMTFKTYGAAAIRTAIADNIELMRRFAGWVDAAPDFERLAPVPLSVVCFRYRPLHMADSDESTVDTINDHLLRALQHEGKFFISGTRLNGRIALRACSVNHRSTPAHARRLLDRLRTLGAAATATLYPPSQTATDTTHV